ncbi:hypothetical protein Q5P01_022120 [Channa striata]|uniref:MACPF domain-containing protein n=1 Tax=Channa striata TaxID=64152 RepID=A0AA88IRY8_CHASR|nr:hypothetical protein Q5P01_022120 [Channa striata]
MVIFNNLVLGLCTLHILINCSAIVNASRRPRTAADNSGLSKRRARAVNSPIPVNCKVGSWSSWTPCNPCTDKKFRFRYLEKPSQFGGTECIDTLWERLACPTATTQCLVPDYCGESFTCKETGRCISQPLRCNGELDCDDSSDEDDCENVNQRDDKCSTLLPIPGAERGTQGYNILTGEFVDHVLDPKYFGGQCEYVYNGEWRKFTYDAFCENLHYNEDDKNYRKPYNYHTYRFVAQATSEGSDEYFEDANITKYKDQNFSFVRLLSKVQTAQFKMRSNKLMLHEDFYVALMELPEQYDFGMYSRFFNTFGTHYVTEGTMGGTLEYVVIFNKTATAQSITEAQQYGSCFSASIGMSKPFGSKGTLDLKVGLNHCTKRTGFSEGSDSSSVMIEDIITLVKGGITSSSSGLLAIRNPDTYRNWGASLKYNPTLINYEIMPIYELVRLSTAADHVGARLANMQRAWEEYLLQFDSCRCAPCRHNGIPILTGTSCSCICKSGYSGDACERTLRRDTETDGLWSCWGAWSSCASGRKTRTRICNNPPPEGGGATCLGSSSQTHRC